MVVNYYVSAFTDKSALYYRNLYLYGGLFDAGATLLNAISPFGVYETRHALNAGVGLLGVAGVWRLAHYLWSPRAGFLAATILVLIPSYYGHMFNNPKDIPFAVGYIWVLYFLSRVIETLPFIPRGLAIGLGLTMGLTLGIRVGGILLFCYLGLIVWVFMVLMFKNDSWKHVGGSIGMLVLPTLGIVILSVLIMLSSWPWALEEPLFRPWQAFQEITHFNWNEPVLFNGQFIPGQQLPWSYLPMLLFVKLPLFVFVLLILGVVMVIRWGRIISAFFYSDRLAWKLAFLIFSVAFPLLFIIVRHSTVYDGLRHVLFILPPVAVLSAVAFDKILTLVGRRKVLLVGFLTLTILYAGYHLSRLIALHPYQYVYFNEILGGLPGAANRFELDYWATSFREAALWLNGYVANPSGEEKIYAVQVCGPKTNASYYFSSKLRLADEQEKADFFLAFTRWGCHKNYPEQPIIGSVQRDETTLAVVKDLRFRNP